MTVLDRILEQKRKELNQPGAFPPVTILRREAEAAPAPPDFRRALREAPVAVIAEIKRRSPSAGPIREPFDPAALARGYAACGAAAISVLVDSRFFGGGEPDVRAVREAVAIPLLYKEFVIDPRQVWTARKLGASAVLLIAAALTAPDLFALRREIATAGLTALVEVHDEAELGPALDSGAECIGINNRDLHTFMTSLDTTERILPLLPQDRLVVSESGLRTAADLVRLKRAGARAFLIGESLLRQPDPPSALRQLLRDTVSQL